MSTATRSNEAVLFTLNTSTVKGSRVYRATATIPGFGPATVRKPEGDSTFPNRSAAMKACKRRADALGYTAKFRNSTPATTATKRCRPV